MYRTCLIGILLALLAPWPLRAQVDSVTSATERAILKAVAEEMVRGIEGWTNSAGRELRVVLDRAVLPHGRADRDGAVWPAAVIEVFESIPGIRVGTLKDYHTCPEDGPPGHCFLVGVDVVISLGRPHLEGDTARITVRRISRASADMDSARAYFSGAGLRVVRDGGNWRIVGADYVSVQD